MSSTLSTDISSILPSLTNNKARKAEASEPHLRQYAEAHITTARFCNHKVILRDNIARNAEAAENCRILAEAEASHLPKNLYTQEDLKISQANVILRGLGINPDANINF